MPRGGIRPRRDGSIDHLLKPKWNSGRTRTIRIPVALAEQLLEIAHKLDNGCRIDVTQDNNAKDGDFLIEECLDLKTEGRNQLIDVIQDNTAELERLNANTAKVIVLLQNAITPKSFGGSYAANNATGIKRLVEQALALLESK